MSCSGVIFAFVCPSKGQLLVRNTCKASVLYAFRLTASASAKAVRHQPGDSDQGQTSTALLLPRPFFRPFIPVR